MTAHIRRLPWSLDPLIAEAKRRMRRRQLLIAAVLVLLAGGTAAGVIAARTPAGGYTSIPWTRGESTQMRYCSDAQAGPSLAGAFLAASSGVTCQTAEAVMRAVRSSPCYSHSPCEANSFRCAAYWSGRFWKTFADTHHALCSDGSRRVVWDGG
jgi:hypothetical protein